MTLFALFTTLFSRLAPVARLDCGPDGRTALPQQAWREASTSRERLLQHDLANWRSSFGV